MKPFNLEEYLKNPSRKVVTRDGQNVKIHCTNYIGAQHIIAQVEGKDYSSSFYEDGRYANDRDESYLDLFFASEKKEGWINLYKSENGWSLGANIWQTEAGAKKWVGAPDHTVTIKIEWAA